MDSGLMGLLASMAPTDQIREQASMLSMLPQAGSPPAVKTGRVGTTPLDAPGANGDWEHYAKQMALQQEGYSRPEWRALDSIIERESGWNPNAVNPNGGAYGIPQILPSAHPGLNLQHDPQGQLDWLFNYIQSRYGGATQALNFKDSHGWY